MEVIDFQIQIFFKQKRDTIVKYFAGKPGWCVHFLLFSFSANCNLSHKKVIDGRKKSLEDKKGKKRNISAFPDLQLSQSRAHTSESRTWKLKPFSFK